ncbi:hypothetical protein AB0L26_16515 [Streptomyces nondiastaticus]|uniref:hypothetical protein n=1 Tax=Streptomyces nondiastaticus TaxID=3154512 RepID=UPI003423331C
MSLFRRNDSDNDPLSEDEAIARAKREGSELLARRAAHDQFDAHRPTPTTSTGDTAGPSCDKASTPRTGRRW